MYQLDGTAAAPAADSMAQALEEYLAAAEAGAAPPREEFLARYPALAEDLDACLAALHFIGRAAEGPRSMVAEVAAVQPQDPMPGQLGDFRIIREVGRGGMGVVYEAEQVSLRRRVALKVLPFAATMDPRQLQRFHNEARAAASLDHPHIVHVHAVGCERAVHFYAMQFIEGQTLAALIADLRQTGGQAVPPEDQPTTLHVHQASASAETAPRAAASTERAPRDRAYFQRVAEWGIQAAEALDHAHGLGIVHRDIKPANLLVDGRGGLWVTDFGLAHIQSDSRLTMTGDLVGTLRYMSPEQALAKRVVIDHRTDVYSLGATLYELLTLEPAFSGNDRQELLRQIAFEEPKPPRRVNKAIPAELETIVLKAIEKNPVDRYATAKDLADDLRRFLADEPIRARPAGVVRRLRKWGRRHQAVVWSAALIALILSASLGWVLGDRQARRAEAEGRVVEALAVAGASLPRGNPHDPELVTAARKAEAQLANGVVRNELRQQVEQVLADLTMLAKLEQIRLDQALVKDGHFDNTGADPAYAQAFREDGIDVDALPVSEAAVRIGQRAIGLQLAFALDDWAMVRQVRERDGDSKGNPSAREPSTWKRLLEVAQAADPDPWRGSLREALANGNRRVADLEKLAASARIEDLPPPTLYVFGTVLRAAGLHSLAAKVLRQGQQRYPADFWIHHQLAFLLAYEMKSPKLEEAIGCYRAALALRPRSPGVHVNFGTALCDMRRLDSAIAEFQEAIRLKEDYAEAYLGLGSVLHDKGRLNEAVARYQEAIRLKGPYAQAHNNLGIALKDQGRLDEAIAEYHKAIRLQPHYAYPHNNLGSALKEKGRLDDAIVEYREALRIKKDYATAHSNLGGALLDKGQIDDAIAELCEAIRIKPDYALGHASLGDALRHKGQVDDAIAEYRVALRLNRDDAKSHNNLGGLLHAKGDDDGASAAWREVIRLNPDKPAAHGNLGRLLMGRGQFAEALPHLRRGHELSLKGASGLETNPFAQWLKECQSCLELEPRLPDILSGREQPADPGQRADYAGLCQKKHLNAAAARLYREAFTAKPELVASLADGLRYDAACVAALAGCGKGEDAAKLPDAERAGLRRQALDWLRADLDAWRGQLDKDPDKARPVVVGNLQHWLRDPDFNGLRGPDALAKIPEAERRSWQKLWADVTATLDHGR